MDTEETPLLGWLNANMGFGPQKTELICKKLEDLWITTVETLVNVLAENDNLLDQIELPKPIQAAFKSKLSSFNSKKMEELAEIEVKHLIEYSFPAESYGQSFLNKKINGFVLSSATGPEKLAEWGVSVMIHAEALWSRLCTWKQLGVPLTLLREAVANDAKQPEKQLIEHKQKQEQKAESFHRGQKRAAGESLGAGSSSSASETYSKHSRKSQQMEVSDDSSEGRGSSSSASSTNRPAKASKVNRELASLLHQTNPEPKRARHSLPPPPPPSTRTVVKIEEEKKRSTTPAKAAKNLPAKSSSEKKKKQKAHQAREYESSVEDNDDAAASMTVNGRIKAHLAKLCTKNKDEQCNALKFLSKQAADHPEVVAIMRAVGVLDKMMEIVGHSDHYEEYVVWRALVALNNIIARSKSLHVRYLVEKGLIALVLPKVHSLSTRIRLQALWIIGNMGTSEGVDGFKSDVLTAELVTNVVQSYYSIGQMSGYNGPDNVRQRYAETINQLACHRTQQQFSLLKAFVPVLRDIIRVEDNVEAVLDACYAVDHLLDAADSSTVDCLIDEDLIPELVRRIDDSKISIAHGVMVTLTVFAECCTSHQVLEMEPALCPLERLIIGDGTYRPNKKLVSQAVICIARISEGGDQSVQQLIDHAPDIFPSLINLVETASGGQLLVRAISESAALAIAHSVQSANRNQLDYFMELKMYSFLFKLLDIFEDHLLLVEEALRAIFTMVLKVEAVEEVQRHEARFEGFNPAEAWDLVQRWTRSPSETVGAEERKDLMEIQACAKRLVMVAKKTGLISEED